MKTKCCELGTTPALQRLVSLQLPSTAPSQTFGVAAMTVMSPTFVMPPATAGVGADTPLRSGGPAPTRVTRQLTAVQWAGMPAMENVPLACVTPVMPRQVTVAPATGLACSLMARPTAVVVAPAAGRQASVSTSAAAAAARAITPRAG